jgi:hypothetical protein
VSSKDASDSALILCACLVAAALFVVLAYIGAK